MSVQSLNAGSPLETTSSSQSVRAPAGPDAERLLQDTHFRLLKLIEARPELSQRDLARELGTSLGKTNYCLKALIDKGFVKVRNFRNNQNKLGYAYLLTPRGIDSKATIAVQFLKRKMAEYEMLKLEIEQLQREIGAGRKTESD